MAVKKLSWTEEYAIEKILPVVCRTHLSSKHAQQQDIDERDTSNTNKTKEDSCILEPIRLTKRRMAAGNPSFDVEWRKCTPNNVTSQEQYHMLPDTFNSCEPELLLREAYPKLVKEFQEAEDAKKKTKARKPKITGKKRSSKPSKLQKSITKFFTQSKASAAQKVPFCENELSERAIMEELNTNSAVSIDVISNVIKANLKTSECKENQHCKPSRKKYMQERTSILKQIAKQ